MATLTKSEIAALSVDERLALIDNLWESIEEPLELLATPDWHREVLDKRIDDADQFPEKSIPWEVAKAELAKKWLS
jgi:putative addiction module component (TIGR02574 family)